MRARNGALVELVQEVIAPGAAARASIGRQDGSAVQESGVR